MAGQVIGLDDQDSVPGTKTYFCIHHHIQNNSEVTVGVLPMGLITHAAIPMAEISPLPMSSWHGACHSSNFTTQLSNFLV
jgi:hypothetical protein